MRRQAWLITGYRSDIGTQFSTKTFRGMFTLLSRLVLIWAAKFRWVPNAPMESGLSRSLICKSMRQDGPIGIIVDHTVGDWSGYHLRLALTRGDKPTFPRDHEVQQNRVVIVVCHCLA